MACHPRTDRLGRAHCWSNPSKPTAVCDAEGLKGATHREGRGTTTSRKSKSTYPSKNIEIITKVLRPPQADVQQDAWQRCLDDGQHLSKASSASAAAPPPPFLSNPSITVTILFLHTIPSVYLDFENTGPRGASTPLRQGRCQ